MEDFASYYKWFVGVALAVVGYFLRDLHDQHKEHLRESDRRETRITVLEARYDNIAARLDDISAKLDRLIERGN